jgi:hypothetical protein
VKEDGKRILMYELTCVVGFKGDGEGCECKVREFSVVEVVCENGKWKAEELRSLWIHCLRRLRDGGTESEGLAENYLRSAIDHSYMAGWSLSGTIVGDVPKGHTYP